MNLRRRTIEKAIKDATGDDVWLWDGGGYFYFSGDKIDNCYSSSVMVCYLNQLSLEQWVNEYKFLVSMYDTLKHGD